MNIWTCPFCKKEKSLESKFTKSGHLAKCVKFSDYKKNVLTVEYLKQKYCKEGKSAIEIAKDNNLESATAIISLLKKHGMKVRGIIEDIKIGNTPKKTEKTMIAKYGIRNAFCRDSIWNKKYYERIKKQYGAINPGQIDEVKIKIKNTFSNRYGGHPLKTDNVIEKIKNTCIERYGTPSPCLIGKKITKPHKIVCDFLIKNNVNFEAEVPVGRYIADVIVENNFVIEINGDFWHANPRKYKSEDILNIGKNGKTAKEIWDKDKLKIDYYNKEGMKNLVLWEYDIIKETQKTEKKICEFLKLKVLEK